MKNIRSFNFAALSIGLLLSITNAQSMQRMSIDAGTPVASSWKFVSGLKNAYNGAYNYVAPKASALIATLPSKDALLAKLPSKEVVDTKIGNGLINVLDASERATQAVKNHKLITAAVIATPVIAGGAYAYNNSVKQSALLIELDTAIDSDMQAVINKGRNLDEADLASTNLVEKIKDASVKEIVKDGFLFTLADFVQEEEGVTLVQLLEKYTEAKIAIAHAAQTTLSKARNTIAKFAQKVKSAMSFSKAQPVMVKALSKKELAASLDLDLLENISGITKEAASRVNAFLSLREEQKDLNIEQVVKAGLQLEALVAPFADCVPAHLQDICQAWNFFVTVAKAYGKATNDTLLPAFVNATEDVSNAIEALYALKANQEKTTIVALKEKAVNMASAIASKAPSIKTTAITGAVAVAVGTGAVVVQKTGLVNKAIKFYNGIDTKAIKNKAVDFYNNFGVNPSTRVLSDKYYVYKSVAKDALKAGLEIAANNKGKIAAGATAVAALGGLTYGLVKYQPTIVEPVEPKQEEKPELVVVPAAQLPELSEEDVDAEYEPQYSVFKI